MRAIAKRLWVIPIALAAILTLGFGAVVHHTYFDRDNLPDLEPFLRFQLASTGRVYDANGSVFFELAREYRSIVKYADLPPVVRDAILSTEDKNFFSHSGVDYSVLPRVLWKNLARSVSRRGRGAAKNGAPQAGIVFSQGGSTITQQLVRGYFLPQMTRRENDSTVAPSGFLTRVTARLVGVSAAHKLARKLEEVRLSLWLEEELERRFGSRRAAKEEILARYASMLYLGNGRYGFATASEYYFDKPLSSYTIDDADKAAVLAGIAKCPRDYAPASRNADRVLRRRNNILDQMVRNHYLTRERAQRCRLAPVPLDAKHLPWTAAPGVIDTVFSELKKLERDNISVEQLVQGRILVHSTVHAGIQTIVNEALENGLRRYEERHHEGRNLIQGSVVVLGNSDGRILAETGGRSVYRERRASYADYNRASGSRRQPGSAIKPIVYLAAFREGATLDHAVPDDPIAVPTGNGEVKWIRNYDDEFKGLIPVREALAESRNAATTWIAEKVGIPRVLETARELGIVTPLGPYISTALGASEVGLVELANAYRAMASGSSAEPHVIQKVTDDSGSVLFVAAGNTGSLQIDPAALQEIQEGLRGVIRLPGGTAHALDSRKFPIPVMGKTGTSSDFRDALFVGSTYGPQGITVAVRVGYDDNGKLGQKETGARAALPIFEEIMLEVYKRRLAGPVPLFPEEMEQRIDSYTACAAGDVESGADGVAGVASIGTRADSAAGDSNGVAGRAGIVTRSDSAASGAGGVASVAHGETTDPVEGTAPRTLRAGFQPGAVISHAVVITNDVLPQDSWTTTRCAHRGLALNRASRWDGGPPPAGASPPAGGAGMPSSQ